MSAGASKKKKTPSFEEALGELENITRRLEGGQLTLDESIQAYEKGMELRRLCAEMLEKAEKKLEYLEKQGNTLVKKSLEDGSDLFGRE